MPSVAGITKMVEGYGFTPIEAPGFFGFERTRKDGVEQSLRIFSWSNKKRGIENNMPHAYLVLCPGFTSLGEEDRVISLMAEWPSWDQVARPWKEVVAEVRTSFLPIFDHPDADACLDLLDQRTSPVLNVPFRALF